MAYKEVIKGEGIGMKTGIIFVKTLSFMYKIVRILWLALPIAAALYTIVVFINNSFYNTKATDMENYKILITAIGLTATLSGLSFRASSGCDTVEKKRHFYYAGECLFLATVVFIFAFLVNYLSSNLARNFELSSYVMKFITVIIFLLQYMLFFSGTSSGMAGLVILRNILDDDIKSNIIKKIKS